MDVTRNEAEERAGDGPADAQAPDPAGGTDTAYRLLYFRSSVLEDWELLRAADLMEALQTASARAPELTVELWSDRRKVAIFRPVSRH